jgi:hypothetical protein
VSHEYGELVVVLVYMLLLADLFLRYVHEKVRWTDLLLQFIVSRFLVEPAEEGWVKVEKAV